MIKNTTLIEAIVKTIFSRNLKEIKEIINSGSIIINFVFNFQPLIIITPSAAGLNSFILAYFYYMEKSLMSLEFDTWNQRFGTFVDDL